MKTTISLILILFTVHIARAGHPDPERMADSIYWAEGGPKAKVPYGVLSIKVANAAEARKITINSINNNWKRWEKAGKPATFIHFMADRWCPPSADPQGNKNWKKNVTLLYNSKTLQPAASASRPRGS